jgi:hypothetical protein
VRLVLVVASTGCMPAPSVPQPAALAVESKGGVDVTIVISGRQVATVRCNGADVLRPGERTVPPLPWELEITALSDNRKLLAARISELPRWVLITSDQASILSSPVAGPPGPPCK